MTLLAMLAIYGWALALWQQLRIWREQELREHWRKAYLRAWQQRNEATDDLFAVLGIPTRPALRVVK